jgi:hypothetical protein
VKAGARLRRTPLAVFIETQAASRKRGVGFTWKIFQEQGIPTSRIQLGI